MVETAEVALHGDKKCEATIASMMLSDAASIVQGLMQYSSHQKHVNDNWMKAYARLLHEHVKSEQCAVS